MRSQLVVDAVVAAFVEQIKIVIGKLGNIVANDARGGLGRLTHILAALAGPGMPEARISRDGLPREITPLVDAVNAALERLARAYATAMREPGARERLPLATPGRRRLL